MATFGSKPIYQDGRKFDFGLSDDKRALTLSFSDLEAKVDQGDSTISSTVFTLALPIEGSAEEKVEIEFAVSGLALTRGGATATIMLSINGKSIVGDFATDVEKELDQRVKFTAEHRPAECRLCVFLIAGRDSGNSNAASFINVLTIDAEFLPRPT